MKQVFREDGLFVVKWVKTASCVNQESMCSPSRRWYVSDINGAFISGACFLKRKWREFFRIWKITRFSIERGTWVEKYNSILCVRARVRVATLNSVYFIFSQLADGDGRASRLLLWNQPGSDITGMVARCEKMASTCEQVREWICVWHMYNSKFLCSASRRRSVSLSHEADDERSKVWRKTLVAPGLRVTTKKKRTLIPEIRVKTVSV